MDEIWGCVKYIGIPYETAMKMTVRQRKEWIRRHNAEQAKIEADSKKQSRGKTTSISGEALNTYARQEQAMAQATGKPR